jgi:hypothetical protein
MPRELILPFFILAIIGITWFVLSHADVPANKKQKNKNGKHRA